MPFSYKGIYNISFLKQKRNRTAKRRAYSSFGIKKSILRLFSLFFIVFLQYLAVFCPFRRFSPFFCRFLPDFAVFSPIFAEFRQISPVFAIFRRIFVILTYVGYIFDQIIKYGQKWDD